LEGDLQSKYGISLSHPDVAISNAIKLEQSKKEEALHYIMLVAFLEAPVPSLSAKMIAFTELTSVLKKQEDKRIKQQLYNQLKYGKEEIPTPI